MPAAPQADHPNALTQRLAEPRTAAAMNVLLDHADLLALLVSGLDGLISRGDTITEALAEGVSELRAVGDPALASATKLASTAKQLGALAPPLLEKLPVLEALLDSDLADPQVIELASMASRAVIKGAEQAHRTDLKVTGIVGLVRALKDPDVSRALGFVLSIAKALGQELDGA